jgi:hypothetical protein
MPRRFSSSSNRTRNTTPKIQEILRGLEEQPSRAEAGWLQTTFAAQDVSLGRGFFKTSYPPKQTLSFRLDDVRYLMNLTRTDMRAEAMRLTFEPNPPAPDGNTHQPDEPKQK